MNTVATPRSSSGRIASRGVPVLIFMLVPSTPSSPSVSHFRTWPSPAHWMSMSASRSLLSSYHSGTVFLEAPESMIGSVALFSERVAASSSFARGSIGMGISMSVVGAGLLPATTIFPVALFFVSLKSAVSLCLFACLTRVFNSSRESDSGLGTAALAVLRFAPTRRPPPPWRLLPPWREPPPWR